ncbi:DM13 domain-containing protein [Vibrio sp. SM6]|uniref:DM13 domain-containing protein n=1 Tax=Vibrio agarilyticus TaxID=2726741 RepID=A0A7X8YH68_9VIBR|nr:DM13 domain-containing protein [Vibrio agarilyticus]NLS13042.1 DM13 domain-containing protein [Vibrio agarilyticus]
MSIKKIVLLTISHIAVGVLGFAAGIYYLPILIAPTAPSSEEINQLALNGQFQAQFERALAGSDALHWGEGQVFLSDEVVTFLGQLAPGPDYKLYLSPTFVENEAEFEQAKAQMIQVGDINTFDNFIVTLPKGVNLAKYNTVIVWCESFGEFITAGQYQ